jgi:5-bromo-4-chloroindolyl phosphate hydrolysis protein
MNKAKRYSPNEANESKFLIKGMLLYILPSPILLALIISLMNGQFKEIILNSIAFTLFLIGATIARRGFRLEKRYKESIIAQAPKIKFKTISAIIISFATIFTSFFPANQGLFLSILLGLVVFVGFYLYYGLDPKIDKIGDLNIGVNGEDVINITSAAKNRVKNIQNLKNDIHNPQIRDLLDTITNETSKIIKSVEENPNDLSRARKFFNVYLYRTEDITKEYVENLNKGNINHNMSDNYTKLLMSVKNTIVKQKQRLDEDDITKLDVQIEALTKQIKNEGV